MAKIILNAHACTFWQRNATLPANAPVIIVSMRSFSRASVRDPSICVHTVPMLVRKTRTFGHVAQFVTMHRLAREVATKMIDRSGGWQQARDTSDGGHQVLERRQSLSITVWRGGRSVKTGVAWFNLCRQGEGNLLFSKTQCGKCSNGTERRGGGRRLAMCFHQTKCGERCLRDHNTSTLYCWQHAPSVAFCSTERH